TKLVRCGRHQRPDSRPTNRTWTLMPYRSSMYNSAAGYSISLYSSTSIITGVAFHFLSLITWLRLRGIPAPLKPHVCVYNSSADGAVHHQPQPHSTQLTVERECCRLSFN
ncbi:unnamed protein product, partial [Pylaiella littoralis]